MSNCSRAPAETHRHEPISVESLWRANLSWCRRANSRLFSTTRRSRRSCWIGGRAWAIAVYAERQRPDGCFPTIPIVASDTSLKTYFSGSAVSPAKLIVRGSSSGFGDLGSTLRRYRGFERRARSFPGPLTLSFSGRDLLTENIKPASCAGIILRGPGHPCRFRGITGATLVWLLWRSALEM